jgi:alpha-galactosidase/6-phospho-beta-glucosidase family protein
VPGRVEPLLTRVKEYERRTVQATLVQSIDRARDALAVNPLVPDLATADRLIADLSPLW